LGGGAEFWSDGGFIGTVGDGVTEDIIRRYVEQQGSPEEKEDYSQYSAACCGDIYLFIPAA
jgi:hypothetical protein